VETAERRFDADEQAPNDVPPDVPDHRVVFRARIIAACSSIARSQRSSQRRPAISKASIVISIFLSPATQPTSSVDPPRRASVVITWSVWINVSEWRSVHPMAHLHRSVKKAVQRARTAAAVRNASEIY